MDEAGCTFDTQSVGLCLAELVPNTQLWLHRPQMEQVREFLKKSDVSTFWLLTKSWNIPIWGQSDSDPLWGQI